MPSALLGKSIAKYNECLFDLKKFLHAETKVCEVNTEQIFKQSFSEVKKMVEPTVINVRSSGSENSAAACEKITAGLVEQGFSILDVKSLVEQEVERQTESGRKIALNMNHGHDCLHDANLVVEVLRHIIYSGNGKDKFLLVGFPEQIHQANIFEKHCATISAIVYVTPKGQPTVEVKGNDLSAKNIDSIFAKEFRLKTMNEWDASTFDGHLGNKVAWGMFTGRSFSGKKTVAAELQKSIKSKLVNMADLAAELKKTMGTEEEPFEGDVPLEKVEDAICQLVHSDRAAHNKFTYLFESWMHKTATDFIGFITHEFGNPTFVINTTCDKKTAEERYKKKNETEEIPEDAAQEMDDSAKKADKQKIEIDQCFASVKGKVRMINLNTNDSLETTLTNLKGLFSAKVIIVNHEKHLVVDTCCSNLAIKYNMLYLSVYQLIKAHITGNTDIGKALMATRKHKNLTQEAKSNADNFQEFEYSAVHFDMELVVKLIQATIAEKRTTQQFILLEGLCNNRKLSDDDDKLSLRYMDELFQIERNIGEVAAVISLQYTAEPTQFTEDKWEEFAPVVIEEKKAPELDEDGNPIEEEAPPEEEEPAKPKWNPAEFKWTVTNRRAKNMPQLFRDYKGINCHCEEKLSTVFSDFKEDSVTKSLDEFCQRVLEDHTARYIYQQVIFEL